MVVNFVQKRIASSEDEYAQFSKSAHSLILAENGTAAEFEVSLTFGSVVSVQHPASNDTFVNVDADGFVLKGKGIATVETRERISVPHNLFGIIFPKGTLAHRYGIVVPTTKVDPGFSGKLRILLVNHSQKSKQIKPDEIIASLSFFSTNHTVKTPVVEPHGEITGLHINWKRRLSMAFERWRDILSSFVIPLTAAIIGALVTLIAQ